MFSVVIPTHDRLDLLRDAVDTVLNQDSTDWELVVFDNASAKELGEYINGIRDPRIRYERSNDFLPVTDSWNRAIELATGDYVTMLGDDDGLIPGYFTKIKKIIESFDSPDVLYSNIYQFCQPNVAPWSPEGYVADLRYGFFFEGRFEPFLLSSREILKAVRGSVDLRRNFLFNMQAFCFNRNFLKRLKEDGPIFRSSFPDYYFANIAFAKAHSVVAIPEPMCIAGIAKASFGYTLFNKLEKKGAMLLNSELSADPLYSSIKGLLLPGPYYDTNYVVAMEHVARYAHDFIGHGVAFGRYRRLQIFRMINETNGLLERSSPEGRLLWSRLSLFEKLWAMRLSTIIKIRCRFSDYQSVVLPRLKQVLEPYDYSAPQKIVSKGQYSRLFDFFTMLALTAKTPVGGEQLSIRTAPKPMKSAASGATDFMQQNGKIAVVYLARTSEGIAPMLRFANSYARNPAGIDHDLVVVYKGCDRIDELNTAKSVFAEIPHIAIEISDKGFDINAYLEAARRLNHSYLCFINTFTEIVANGWLSMLYRHVSSEGVGIVGTTASFESLNDSVALINKVIWLCNDLRIKYDPVLAYFYEFALDMYCQAWRDAGKKTGVRSIPMLLKLIDRIHRKISSFFNSIRRLFTLLAQRDWSTIKLRIRTKLSRRIKLLKIRKIIKNHSSVDSVLHDESIEKDFKTKWKSKNTHDEKKTAYSDFPPFPNPHIRSNGFMISRNRFLELKLHQIEKKLDACAFESGVDGMTNQIRRQGLKTLVVGRSGSAYDLEDWVKSKTFRLGDQEDLIFIDNQTRNFDRMTPGSKATHVRMTWGDYLEPAPPNFLDLGFKFAISPSFKTIPAHDRRKTIPAPHHRNGVKFSFLIPSKNRVELLRFAINSILRQQYSDFEIIISDNASKQDYAGLIRNINDKRIAYKRLSKPVSVTENWRSALARASGEYVLMLGDDDALTPWFLPTLSDIIINGGRPDIVYSPAYHYCYPKVIPWQPKGYLADVRNSVFLEGKKSPFFLPPEQTRASAKGIYDFRLLYGMNSQHFIFKAEFLKSLSTLGGVFQSPYPDTFAAIVSFFKAGSILVVPDSMTIIGISPKSFGYYYFNRLQSKGYKFLDNDQVPEAIQKSLSDVILPGDKNNTFWLVGAEQARQALELDGDLTVNFARYRSLQMVAFLQDFYRKKIHLSKEINAFTAKLTPSEQVSFSVMRETIEKARASGKENVEKAFQSMSQEIGQYPTPQVKMVDIGSHSNIEDAFNYLAKIHPRPPRTFTERVSYARKDD